MLNGKFFTGLPPKMIDRGSSGGRNRMESHLFWPDDTKLDTVVESRIKRRNSVQLAYRDKPLYEKQNTVVDDVDTRKRFSKEFSQSSIQFYDNLNDNNANSRRSMLRNSAANKKMEITDKPTNTKQQLSDSIVNEAYTAAKKKQAYTSNIEFYDYDKEEPQYRRNNLRKPKMDMNDKREMELNTKNSPKLQVKRDVRSLSEENELRKINNREVRTTERPTHIKTNINDGREEFGQNEDSYLRNRRSVEPRMSTSPKRGWTKSSSNRQQRYSGEREMYREPLPLSYDRRKPASYAYSEERDYRADTEEPKLIENRRFVPRTNENPEMIRNSSRQYYDAPDDIVYSHRYLAEKEIRDRVRDIYLKSPPSPARKQYYPIEDHYDDEPQYNYVQNDQVKTPTNRGSSHQRFDFSDRQGSEVNLPYKDYNNSPKRSSGNKLAANKLNNQFERERLTSPTSPPPPSDTESSVSATKSQKHLRSSLCFNNGEIIGENDATRSPTSSQHPSQKRNARSSATQRVSVGLPD